MKQIGILGFGEAGSAFAKTLADNNADVFIYDSKWETPNTKPPLIENSNCHQIRFCSLSDLLASAEIVLSTVTTNSALSAAKTCMSGLSSQHLYCDLNSTAPSVKVDLYNLLERAKIKFVEGAILGAIGVTGGQTKILLGGELAADLSQILNSLGLNTLPYSNKIGQVSAFKMLRSIFSKGLEALILEFLVAGRKSGLEKDLWCEVTALFDTNKFEDIAKNWVCSHAIANERRFHELVQVADLLEDMKLDSIMTNATLAFFKRSADWKISRDFPNKPSEMDELIEDLTHRISK